jgi:hypothetical protein
VSRPYAPIEQRLRAFIEYARNIPKATEQIRVNLRPPFPRTYIDLGKTVFGGLAKFYQNDAKAAFAAVADPHLQKQFDAVVPIAAKSMQEMARLKPKIPSLPQFSFRWDYRYEHLNVDIHGVEPAVIDWWTMGENGYTGHLPRRLGGPGYAFEAIIWLPVTFVFRGRLTLSLRGSPEAGEDSPSVATTTGGIRKLWAKWPTFPK